MQKCTGTCTSAALFFGNCSSFWPMATMLFSMSDLQLEHAGPPGRAKFEYKWAKRDAIGKTIPRSSYVFSVNGLSPCCVNIPGNGSIMGTCDINLNQSLAFYTWDRLQHATSISNADLLYIVPAGGFMPLIGCGEPAPDPSAQGPAGLSHSLMQVCLAKL